MIYEPQAWPIASKCSKHATKGLRVHKSSLNKSKLTN